MKVPDEVNRLRQEVIEKNGMRRDDIEFTFAKGRWSHLGEATLMNRVKSHPDVGERWVCLCFVPVFASLHLLTREKVPIAVEANKRRTGEHEPKYRGGSLMSFWAEHYEGEQLGCHRWF